MRLHIEARESGRNTGKSLYTGNLRNRTITSLA